MKQVFFKTVSALEAAGGTAGTDRFTDMTAAGTLGFWCLDAATGGAWADGSTGGDSPLFQKAFDTEAEGASDASAALTTVANPIMLKNKIQVVQSFGTGSNPMASPIINTADIARITCSGHVATTQYAVTYTPGTNEKVASNEVQFRFVVRQGSTQYLDFVNNEAAFADLSDGTHRFPLSGFHANTHKLITISINTGGGSAANVCDALRAAIQNHGVLNAMIKTSGSSTAVLTARHPGVVFEVIGHNLTDDLAVAAGDFALSDFIPGVGNAWQARTDELQARALQGDFNRMYFPMSQTDFVTSASTEYDQYEIIYKVNGDWGPVKGSVYGCATIYEVNGQNAVGNFLNAGTGDPSNNKVEYIFGRSH